MEILLTATLAPPAPPAAGDEALPFVVDEGGVTQAPPPAPRAGLLPVAWQEEELPPQGPFAPDDSPAWEPRRTARARPPRLAFADSSCGQAFVGEEDGNGVTPPPAAWKCAAPWLDGEERVPPPAPFGLDEGRWEPRRTARARPPRLAFADSSCGTQGPPPGFALEDATFLAPTPRTPWEPDCELWLGDEGATFSTPVYDAAAKAVQTTIRGLGLAGIPSAQVYLLKLPSDRGTLPVTLPCVIVSTGPDAESLPGGTNARDDYGPPVLVTVLRASNQQLALDNTWLAWREGVRRAFHNKRLAGVPAVWKCVVEPRAVVDAGLFHDENLDVQQLLVRPIDRDTRS